MVQQKIKVMIRFKKNSEAQLNQFKVGDRVAIYDKVSGERAFEGTIRSIDERAKRISGRVGYVRYAQIEVNGGILTNTLATAVVI